MSEYIIQLSTAAVSLSALGIFFGLILSVASKKLHVPKDPREEAIIEALPGANCGACGEPGCAAYAHNILTKNIPVNLCPVGGRDCTSKISEIMGILAESETPKTARVHCQGGLANTRVKFNYTGPESCSAASQISDGFRVCSYGCLGLGDCSISCPFDAIKMNSNNIPVIDPKKCTGCGICANTCPRKIISLVEDFREIYVKCMNREKGAIMKEGCKVGCIGCQLCVSKACRIEFTDRTDGVCAMKVDSFLAQIDYSICTDCGKCATICPQKVIELKNVHK